MAPYLSKLEDSPADPADVVEEDLVLKKAVDSYRKVMERDNLTDGQREEIEQRIKAMENREIVERIVEHEPKEILSDDDKVMIGPPTLTRFEKARIMGARALQLSLGAPPFVEIPVGTKTSLVIAMEELDLRVIPIVIRRALPNGDYQNIPIEHFA